MTLIRCPRCNHMSIDQIDTSEIIGTIQCVKGSEALMKKRQYGPKCLLCGYSNLRIEVIDSKNHRVA